MLLLMKLNDFHNIILVIIPCALCFNFFNKLNLHITIFVRVPFLLYKLETLLETIFGFTTWARL